MGSKRFTKIAIKLTVGGPGSGGGQHYVGKGCTGQQMGQTHSECPFTSNRQYIPEFGF